MKMKKEEAIEFCANQLVKTLNLSEDRAIKLSTRYFGICSRFLLEGYLRSSTSLINSDRLLINYDEFRRSCRFQVNGVTHYFDDYLGLVQVLEKGSNITNKQSTVRSLVEVEDVLDKTPEEIVIQVFDDLTGNEEIHSVHIDMHNLAKYIDDINARLAGNLDKALRNDLSRKLAYSSVIFKVALINEDHLPMIVSESFFGRRYYQGPNLQSCPKEVRAAALGPGSRIIDLNNAVFQFKFNAATELDPSLKLPYTQEYLERKDTIRQDIANQVTFSQSLSNKKRLEIIKRAFTAIGHGSMTPLNRNPNQALGEVFLNDGQYKIFRLNPWVCEFINEQKKINDLLVNLVKQEMPHLKKDLSNNRGWSASKVVAFLYQQTERSLIEGACKLANCKPSVYLHDGFALFKPSAETIKDLRYYFQSEGYSISVECIEAATSKRALDEYDADLLTHIETLNNEERKAGSSFRHFLPKIPTKAKSDDSGNTRSYTGDEFLEEDDYLEGERKLLLANLDGVKLSSLPHEIEPYLKRKH